MYIATYNDALLPDADTLTAQTCRKVWFANFKPACGGLGVTCWVVRRKCRTGSEIIDSITEFRVLSLVNEGMDIMNMELYH